MDELEKVDPFTYDFIIVFMEDLEEAFVCRARGFNDKQSVLDFCVLTEAKFMMEYGDCVEIQYEETDTDVPYWEEGYQNKETGEWFLGM